MKSISRVMLFYPGCKKEVVILKSFNSLKKAVNQIFREMFS
jgi:hypothetical protein